MPAVVATRTWGYVASTLIAIHDLSRL